MDPSYNNSFGSFSSGGAGGQPGMMNFAQNNMSSVDNDVILTLAPERKKKKMTKWIMVVAGVLTVVIAVATYIVLSNNARAAFAQNARDLYSSLTWVSYTGQCESVALELENMNYTKDAYGELIDKCREKAQTLQGVMRDLDGRGGQDFAEIYDGIKNEIDKIVVVGDDLEAELKIYSAWHEWLLSNKNISKHVTSYDIDKMVTILNDSGNEALIKYGEGWAERKKAAVRALLYAEIYEGDVAKQEELMQRNAEFENYAANDKPNILDLTKIGVVGEEYRELRRGVLKLEAYIREKL